MNKVPTAEDIMSKKFSELKASFTLSDMKECMIEFAKLHVEAQRDDILKKVSLTDFAQEFLQEGASDAIDEESIINAYPLEKIK